MPYEKVQPEKLSAAVVRQIELLILRGILRPGERLPPERELAERLAVSRPSLREAIADLRDKGLLSSRRGAGVYVADVLGSAFSPALVHLFAAYDEALFDAIAFRRDMEGLAAERAARFGSDTDLAVIDAAFSRMSSARPGEEAARDADFHMAIIEAGNNVILLHMMRAMYDLLAAGVFYNRQVVFSRNTTRAQLLHQHAAINDALQARDATAARAAVEDHLDFVAAALHARLRSEANETVARQRLGHDTEADRTY